MSASASADAAPAAAAAAAPSTEPEPAPMGDCCTTGYLDEGETTGTVGKLGGCNTYFARPAAATDKALLICTDVFGYELINVRLLADEVCKQTGFLVVVPDLFDGDALPVTMMTLIETKSTTWWEAIQKGARVFGALAFNMIPWMIRHGDSGVRPKLDAIVADLRTNHGIKRLASQGFCWGGRYSILLATNDSVDVCMATHPSRVAFPVDVQNITKPAFFACAESDYVFPAKWIPNLEKILADKKRPYKVKVYPKTSHGFAVRGNASDPHISAMRKEALLDSAEFLRANL